MAFWLVIVPSIGRHFLVVIGAPENSDLRQDVVDLIMAGAMVDICGATLDTVMVERWALFLW